jgi:hypothetical protein
MSYASLLLPPAWLWSSIIPLATYYAFRGAIGNWYGMQQLNSTRHQSLKLPRWVIVSVYCTHDALLHFLCTVVGALSMCMFYRVCEASVVSADLDAGRAGLIVLALTLGLFGLTGQLPALLLQGKLPGR